MLLGPWVSVLDAVHSKHSDKPSFKPASRNHHYSMRGIHVRNSTTVEHHGDVTRNITWTHYYGAEDTYSRIDYILLSPGMAKVLLVTLPTSTPC